MMNRLWQPVMATGCTIRQDNDVVLACIMTCAAFQQSKSNTKIVPDPMSNISRHLRVAQSGTDVALSGQSELGFWAHECLAKSIMRH